MTTPSRYWREIPQRYRGEANSCEKCKKKFFPPRLICPKCGNRDLAKAKIADKGKVLSFTIIRVPPSPFKDQAPYAVGIVELKDGVKIMGQIVECDFKDLKVGLPVKIEFRKMFKEGHSGILCYGYKFVPDS
ncbi:MAG: transcriptional regulator [Candidatus Aminicenantes bacterium]|nr:transcriptional regulator [Candidatus Aminicenantes bacterium]